jgi:serine/threonine-protein kinase
MSASKPPIDADVAELVRAERLDAAAALAASRNEPALASEIYERGCRFGLAAEQSLLAGDHARALVLAAIAEDDALAERAFSGLTGEAARARVAHELGARAQHGWRARVLESLGRAEEAAAAWARAGRADRAADLLERLGEPIEAARALEAAIKASPERHDLRVQLGRMLVRHGRLEPGVRVLQRVPRAAPERALVLGELVRAFEALGLPLAAAEARAELEAGGGSTKARASEHPPPTAPRARLFGRYEVEREVASTASARVLECTDVLTSERVALKVFAGAGLRGVGRDALARFEREVSILEGLRHPNVVPLRAYVAEGPALALAWMAGGTLREMLDRGPLAPARAIEIAAAVLDALAAAHRSGVIHRDVKPSNVLFDGAGAARLSDFGAAHLGDLAATATAGIIGTFAYMSPEQREGRPATVQSDVYSVGVLLREMLTGDPPLGGARVEPSAVHRDLAAAHDAVVARLTSVRPEDRPRDAAAARQLLLSLSWPTTCEPAAPRAATPRPARAIEERLEAVADAPGIFVDRWTGGRVRVVPLTPRVLARARAFAAAEGRGVDLVLRVDAKRDELWIEEREDPALSRALRRDEARALERALGVLHEHGIAHGHVDRAHVRVSERFGVRLTFEADAAPTATADLDRIALATLVREPA